MTFKHQDELKNSPYYDDFNDEKNFLQILFKPGTAVQARELTQLQSILQNQISKVSDHLFKDGSQIFGANVSLTNYFFLRVKDGTIKDSNNTVLNNSKDFSDYDVCSGYFKGRSFVPKSFTYNTTLYTARAGVVGILDDVDFQIKIFDVLREETSDDIILIFSFMKGNLTNLRKLTNIIVTEVTATNHTTLIATDVKTTNDNPIDFQIIERVGSGNTMLLENFNTVMVAAVSPGIFYKDGRFINTSESTTTLYKRSEASSGYMEIEDTMLTGVRLTSNATNQPFLGRKLFSHPTKRIGFDITTEIVDVDADPTLADNAIGSYNEKAPGADRLIINFTLTNKDFEINLLDNYNSNTFVEVARISKGSTDFIKSGTDYSEILKLFAKRTHDESGSYVIYPFTLDFKQHLRKDLYTIVGTLTPGGTLPEEGDLFLQTTLSGNVVSVRYSGSSPSTPTLLFPTQTSMASSTKKLPKDITTEPIGMVDSVMVSGSTVTVTVISLNGVTFSGLAINTQFSIKQADLTDDKTGFTSSIKSDALPSFKMDIDGVYAPNDTIIGDESKFIAKLNPGKAYIEGFEYENLLPQKVTLNKARDIFSNSSVIDAQLSNIIYMKPLEGLFNNITTDIFKEELEIRGSDVVINFLGTTEGSFAEGELIHWAPFKNGAIVNDSNTNIHINNKEIVAFISGSV